MTKNRIANIWPINKSSSIIAFKVIMSFSLLFVGGVIYLGWRSGNLVMFQVLERWGMSDFLMSFRCICSDCTLFYWIKYSMPDGLWLFSYMFLIDTIWHNHKHVTYYVFLWSLPIIAVMSELLQFVAIVPGTFDIADLFSYLLAVIIFLILNLF